MHELITIQTINNYRGGKEKKKKKSVICTVEHQLSGRVKITKTVTKFAETKTAWNGMM